MTTDRKLHFAALLAGVLAIGVLVTTANGPVTYLLCAGVGIVAVVIGHNALKRPGPLLWIAVVGLVLAYLQVLVAIGLLLVRLSRVFGGEVTA